MKLRLVVEFDPETKRWAAFFPELPGCASAGDTEEEAVTNAKEALDLWFEPSPLSLSSDAKVVEVALARAASSQFATPRMLFVSSVSTASLRSAKREVIRNGVTPSDDKSSSHFTAASPFR